MRLERLTLTNFRSYKKQVFKLGQKTIVVAANGSGKTNLLEAIELLSSGESERAGKVEEMIRWGQLSGSVSGVIEEGEKYTELTVVLTRGVMMGKKTPKRRLLVDGVARARSGYLGRVTSVVFRPEDMRLLEGSPSRRRSYLDGVLSSAHPDYARALTSYGAAIIRRNRLLDRIREGTARRVELSYWDQALVKNGDIIANYRRDYLDFLGEQVTTTFGKYKLVYKASAISMTRLTEHIEAEIAIGYTLVGPHKDDFRILADISNKEEGIDLMVYGSRGEQRLGVLYLKIGSMQYLQRELAVSPILLLDDIFSELDAEHRELVAQMAKDSQVILTSAEPEAIKYMPNAEIIRLGESGE